MIDYYETILMMKSKNHLTLPVRKIIFYSENLPQNGLESLVARNRGPRYFDLLEK